MDLPRRRLLDHTLPPWVKGAPIFFITICATRRQINQFCQPTMASVILGAARRYHKLGRWHALVFLLMPDHLHALVSFPKAGSMDLVVRSWKHYLATQHRVAWQRDYFDHRLRNDESHEAKVNYIRNNPVRAGLVAKPEDWPYVWEPER
ncbi:MAG TPA: transposase [Lacunisphaera sp.]|nr:transposase [Lacunisphaera sp.]